MTVCSCLIVFLMSDCWFKWKSLNIECWTKYNEWHQNKTFIVSFHLPIVPLILHCFFNTEFEYWGFSCLYHSNHFYRFFTNWSDLPISTVHLRYLYFCISTKFSLVLYSLTWACWGSCVFLQRFPHTNTFLVEDDIVYGFLKICAATLLFGKLMHYVDFMNMIIQVVARYLNEINFVPYL